MMTQDRSISKVKISYRHGDGRSQQKSGCYSALAKYHTQSTGGVVKTCEIFINRRKKKHIRPLMMMHLTSSRAYYRPQPVPKMPAGLVELMEGMTREVLKHNPPDVYEFCANHMQQLLVLRDGKAPKSHKLSLEQKIKNAQKKVRETAEQRRRLYDQAMQTISSDATPGISSDKNTETVNIIANTDHVDKSEETSEVESPTPVEINSVVDNVVEGKLKGPVHHEKELTDALEVEIFHKPLENVETNNEMVEEIKDNVQSEQDIVESTTKIFKSVQEKDPSTDEPIKIAADTVSADELKSKISNRDLELADEGKEVLQNQIRASRSVEDEENIGIQQDYKETDIETEPGTNIKSVEESFEILSTEIDTDQVSNTKVSVVSSAEDINNTVYMDGQNSEIATKEHFDKSATFAYEIIENVSFPKQENLNMEIFEVNHGDSSDTKGLGEQSNPILESQKSLILDEVPEKSQVEQGTSYTEQNTTNLGTEQLEKIIESTVEDSLKNMSYADSKNYGQNYSNEFSSIEKEKSCSSEYDNVGSGSNLQEVKEIVKPESVNNNENREELSKATDVANKTVLPSDDSVTVESNSKNYESSGPSENIDTKSSAESSDPEASLSVTTVETENEILDKEQKSINDEHTSEAITTVDKYLMEESAIVKDDNNSAPSATTESETTPNNGTEHVNGYHTSNEVYENGDETPEPSITKSLEGSFNETVHSEKRDDNVRDIQDNASTASELHKTETSSIEEPSSMEEHVLEESIDSMTEVEIIDPNSEKDKENQTAMDLETAAVTIQKVFRSFLFKKSTFDDTGMEGANSIDDDNEKVEIEFPVTTTPINKERRTLGISRMDTVLQTVNEEKSLSLSTDDSSLSSAATIIQAHIRGFLVRNRLTSNRTNSASLGKSEGPSMSLEADNAQKTNKTILNIHIVPEGEHFISRDESLLTSMELSLDGSPPSSTNLHPLGYDKSEPRKQLKREDAIQSISPPSNNSGKLSEEVDSVKDIEEQQRNVKGLRNDPGQDAYTNSRDSSPTKSTTIETVIEAHKISRDSSSPDPKKDYPDAHERRKRSLEKAHSDESDVVCEDKGSIDSDNTLGLLHSGEFHDIVLPTKVSRADTTVVREFKNVFVYFLLWNNAA